MQAPQGTWGFKNIQGLHKISGWGQSGDSLPQKALNETEKYLNISPTPRIRRTIILLIIDMYQEMGFEVAEVVVAL